MLSRLVSSILTRLGARVGLSRGGRLSKALGSAWSSVTARFAGGAAAGGLTGFGLGQLADRLGVESNQLQAAVLVGLALAALAAVGQLFDVQIGD